MGMHKLRLCALLLAALAVQSTAKAQKINLPPVTRATLDNGIRVVLMEYHRAPTLTVSALFPGGSSADTPDKVGVASLTADLLRKGTEKRTAPQIAEEMDFLGGSLDAGAGDDAFTVGLDVQAKNTDAGLEMMTDILRHPTFPAEELERTRQLTVAGLETLSDEPQSVSRRVATEIVYAGHPYGLEPTVTSIKAITRDDLVAYYKKFIVPDRMILVAVGDFKTANMLAKLKAQFGDWPKTGADSFVAPPVKPLSRRMVMIDKPDATQTYVRWVRTAFPRTSPDYFPAQIADAILGGGFTSRLIDEIRVNRSLTYGISSSFAEQLRGGRFTVATFTKIETTRALLDATNGVLKKAAQGLTLEEVKKFKGYLEGGFAIGAQTPEALAGQLAEIALYNLPNDYLQTYLPRLRAVTVADVNRIARTYFVPEKLSVVLVAPAKKVDAQLKGLGTFETRPVETVGK